MVNYIADTAATIKQDLLSVYEMLKRTIGKRDTIELTYTPPQPVATEQLPVDDIYSQRQLLQALNSGAEGLADGEFMPTSEYTPGVLRYVAKNKEGEPTGTVIIANEDGLIPGDIIELAQRQLKAQEEVKHLPKQRKSSPKKHKPSAEPKQG